MKTWIRLRSAGFSASAAASISRSWQRASAAITGRLTVSATCCTPRRSPCDAAGKPASMTSTPSASSWRASRSLPSGDIAFPGACSPSRSVVSKMMTSLAIALLLRGGKKKTANLMGFAAPVLLRPTFERLLDSYLRARRDPPAECKAQQQDEGEQQQRHWAHLTTVISTHNGACQE